MKELVKQVDALNRDVEKLKSLQDAGASSGVTSVTGTSPIASSGGTTPAISLANSGVTPGPYSNPNLTIDIHGLVSAASSGVSPVTSVGATAPVTSTGGTTPTIGISITPANPGGAVALQAAYPGTAQTGNGHVTGTLGADTRFNLNTIPMLERGGTFPASPVDGQRYFHTTYRSWFDYNSTDALWRQEAPGVFSGSFPTVASGDNTVAPKIQVMRIDQNNITYFWDGTRWLGPQNFGTILYFPGIASNKFTVNTNNVWADTHPNGVNDIYFESIKSVFFVNTNNSGNNSTSYWTATYRFRNSSATPTVTGTVNTATFTAGVSTVLTLLSNTVVTQANFFDLFIDLAKGGTTGTPGDLFVDPFKIIWRLVG